MRLKSVIFVCLLAAQPTLAVRYSIDHLSAAEATIAYNLNEQEISSPPTERTFCVAFACCPGVSYGVAAGGQASGGTAALDAKIIRSGWAGNNYLVWAAFSPYLRGGAVKALPRGTITLSGGTPFIAQTSPSKARVNNEIVYVPLLQSMKKTHSGPMPYLPFQRGVKFEVDKDGIYEVSAIDLQRLGVPVGSTPSKMFRLLRGTDEIPLYITNPQRATMQSDDRILFYGTFLRGVESYYTQFSNTNAYWLTWDGNRPGARVAMVSGAQRKDAKRYGQQQTQLLARDFQDTLHLEEDNDIRWLGSIDMVSDIGDAPDTGETLDNWYWGIIGQDYSTGFTIDIPPPSGDQNAKARLRIGVMGLTTNSAEARDHNWAVTLNDNPLGDTLQTFGWKGQTPFTYLSDPFPLSRIKAGKNVLSFLCQSKFSDMIALNWVDIEYVRTFATQSNRLLFKNNPLDTGAVYEFDVGGFSSDSLDVWDIGAYRIFTDFEVQASGRAGAPSYTLMFQDSLTKVNSYFAQTAGNRLKPASMRLDTLRSGWDTLVNADYIAVTVDSFIPLFKPLVEVYKKRGLSVAVVDVSDVYNSFSGGIHDPESIRSLLRYLFSLEAKKYPRYLLLGGDTSHDLDKNRRERNIVPTHLSRVPGWGPSSNDGYFATVGNDNFPAMFVGRFPAENKKHMATMVDKTVKSLTAPEPGFWRDNLLLLGGWENDFTNFNNAVSSQVIGANMNVYRMDADTGSPEYKNEFIASKTITDYINAGVYAINFNGHGGGNIWSDSKFFGYNDLNNLYNAQWGASGKLPFVFSYTCLTGFFESVFYRSLGEEFLRQSPNGALCFFGASAYTSKQANMIMNRIMLDHAVNASVESVGELLWFTKMEMLARYGAQYLPVVRQYNLLGDPALPWSLAPDSLRLSLSDSLLDGHDSLVVNAACSPLNWGQARVTVWADGKKWDERIDDISKGSFSETVRIKDSIKTASGVVRAYAWNDSQHLRGFAAFSKTAVPVLNVMLDKDPVHFGDTVFVSCGYSPPASAGSVVMLCLYTLSPLPPSLQGGGNDNAVSMHQNGNGSWISGPVPVVFSGRIGDILFVRFRVAYTSEAGAVSDTSRVYSFTIEGRPDLVFTIDTLRAAWDGDSIRINFQALNAGNAVAPPFRAVFFWGGSENGDTLRAVAFADSLAPGKTVSGGVAVPDTQGTVAVTACLNAGRAFPEILFDNNQKTAVFTVAYADLKSVNDSLFSSGKGLCIVPAGGFDRERRVFLFSNTALPPKPLATPSAWAPVRGDSVALFFIGARPALSRADSCAWIFFRDTGALARETSQAASEKLKVLRLDSALAAWRFASGDWPPSQATAIMHSRLTGPFALALLSDLTPPQIRASVNGREVLFLDYAAKDKPFDIRISDASGVAPNSITLRLNGKALDSESVSHAAPQNGLSEILLTAYPQKQRAVDSLSVGAEDLAGNVAEVVFAYMPGEELGIKFFSCHPNPFTAAQDARGATLQTIRFAYLLTDVARDVSIVVYTIGGRPVWKWRKSNGTIGYQEVEWNGKTSDGHRIANGTYYAKCVAVGDTKKAVSTIRIAKLEGY
jgi:hypothetical protein